MIWAVHFFALYGIAEFARSGTWQRAAVGVVTVACLGLLIAPAVRASAVGASKAEFSRWHGYTARVLVLLSTIAVSWQALPALLL